MSIAHEPGSPHPAGKTPLPLRAPLLAVVVLAACLVPSLEAQSLRLRTDLTLSRQHVWRGLSTGRPEATFGMLLAPRRPLSFPFRSYFSVGFWASGLPLGLEDSDATRNTIPLENELDVWAGLSGRLGERVRLGAGLIYYFYNDFLGSDPGKAIENTGEVYARIEDLEFLSLPMTLRVAGWVDVVRRTGIYLEPSVTARIRLWPRSLFPNSSLQLTALAGVTTQSVDEEVMPPRGNFANDGVTHFAFAATLPQLRVFLSRGPSPTSLAYTLRGQVIVSSDPFVRDGQWDISLTMSYIL